MLYWNNVLLTSLHIFSGCTQLRFKSHGASPVANNLQAFLWSPQKHSSANTLLESCIPKDHLVCILLMVIAGDWLDWLTVIRDADRPIGQEMCGAMVLTVSRFADWPATRGIIPETTLHHHIAMSTWRMPVFSRSSLRKRTNVRLCLRGLKGQKTSGEAL